MGADTENGSIRSASPAFRHPVSRTLAEHAAFSGEAGDYDEAAGGCTRSHNSARARHRKGKNDARCVAIRSR
jgi:hypothetical protein